MMKVFKMLRYPILDGIYFPFKIYQKTKIRIRASADFKLDGRITFGNSDKKAAVISAIPANLYLGFKSKIRIGHSVSIGPGVNIIVKDNANLIIEENTYFTSDLHIEVVNVVQIGKNCAISWGGTIIDDDHHTISYADKNENGRNHVKIGDHVWIGCNCVILKGTEVGNNCVIAAGSVVKGVFPENCLIGGNPAKILKRNITWR
ncbi:MAG TPA: acyltransferase [Bacteroidia bacterium]|jgi:acetyltransferase-like isoleucine patch superfamily enzyme